MSHVRESFPVLVDATGEGTDIRAMQVGDAPASKNGLIGFSFKDSSGNVVLPTLASNGTLPVSLGAASTPKSVRNENAGSLTALVVASLTLTASKVYEELCVTVSSYQETHFQLVQVDDATTTVIDDYIVGPGQYTFHADLCNTTITAGATGTQVLKIMGTNLKKASNMQARISAAELV